MTPDTTHYMVAGYAIIFSVMAIYLISLIFRWRNLERDQRMLTDMEKK